MIVREKGRFIPLVKIIFPKGNDRGKYDFSGGGINLQISRTFMPYILNFIINCFQTIVKQ